MAEIPFDNSTYEAPVQPINENGSVAPLPKFNPPAVSDPSAGNTQRLSFDEMVLGLAKPSGADFIPGSSIDSSGKYKEVLPFADHEEGAAQYQNNWEKWGNGIGKFLGTTATTALEGTVGTLYGLGQYIATGKFSSIYDNPVNRYLDEFNKNMEKWLPNYYSHAEQDAKWYSPDNILTANFWSDKVLKNLGFSAGTILGGFGWGAAFRAIGLTSKLVKVGKGLELLTAVDDAIVNAPKAARFGAVTRAIEETAKKSLLSTTGKVLTNADRTLISVMGSMGEASIESLQNLNEFRNKLIDDFVAQNGRAPLESEMLEINEYAEKAGNFTWGMNVALLSATNYIQLPKILSTSRTAERLTINNITRESVKKGATTIEKAGAKYISGPSMLGRLGKPGRLLDKYVVKPGSLFIAPIEGFEEFAQYSIQKGTADFFSSGYEVNADVTEFWSNLQETLGNVLNEGVYETLHSKEGMEGMLIGTISGGIQTSFSPFGENKLKERGFFGTGGKRVVNTDAALSALNKTNLNEVLRSRIAYVNRGINAQTKRQAAILDDDVLNEKDYEKDYVLSYVLPRVKYGKVDAIKEELDLYKQLAVSENGLSELKANGIALEKDNLESFLARLESIEKTAQEVNETYTKLNTKYAGILNEDGSQKYSSETIEKLTYAIARIADYDNRLQGLDNDLAGVVNTSDIRTLIEKSEAWASKDLSKVADDEALGKLLDKAKADIAAQVPVENDELRAKVVDFAEMIILRQAFINEYEDIKNNPQNYKENIPSENKVVLTEEEKKQYPSKSITIKTKSGEKEIQTNEEYLLSKRVYKDKNGEFVYTAPMIIILDENEDGTLRVKDSKGQIKDISKEDLEPYNLTKFSSLQQNKKAKFVFDHWNTKFKHYGVKDKSGNPIIGRLEYRSSDDKVIFVWTENGKEYRKEAYNYDFVAKKNYPHAKIVNVGTRTAVQEVSFNEYTTLTDTLSEKIAARNSLIREIYENKVAHIDKITAKIQANKQSLQKIAEDLEVETQNLEDLNKKKRKSIKKRQAIEKQIKKLTELKTNIEEDNRVLESEKSDLESALPFFEDIINDLEDLPDDTNETIAQLKQDISNIEELIENDKELIALNKNLLTQIEELIDSSLNIINSFIEDFKRLNPDVPPTMEALRDRLESYMGEEGAKRIIEERLGFAETILEFESELNALQEELKIPDLSKKADELAEQINTLESGLSRYIAMYNGKKEIMDALQEYVDRLKKIEEEEEQLQKNEALKNKFIGTLGTHLQNTFSTKTYEPNAKKDQSAVVRATMPIDDGKEHQKRANRFGFLYHKMANKDKLKAIVVTQKTEDELLPGLIEHLMSNLTTQQKEKYKMEEVIAMVIVQVNDDNTYTLVDEEGNPLKEDVNALEQAIYQTFPMDDLMATYPKDDGTTSRETMFREGTDPETKEFLTARYKEWRKRQLEKKELSDPEDIKVSFGIPEYVTQTNEHGKQERDYTAKVTPEEAGLLEPGELEKGPRITIAVTNDSITEGSVTFNTPKGRVFLRIPGAGLAKLFNRKFTQQEANTIFNVILQISKNGVKRGEISKDTMELIEWLKSVVYWGIAKDLQTGERKPAGYNNIWFERVKEGNEDVLKLFMSGLSAETKQGFLFTPTALEENKHSIVSLLQQMYHNTYATRLNDKQWNTPYFEVIGIDEEGNPQYREWNNYQTYLLSDKYKDGSPRSKDEIPLVTQFRPLVDKNDSNRKGIYFILDSDTNEFDVPKKTKKAEKKAETKKDETKKEESKVETKEKAKEAPKTPVVYKLDGSQETMTFSSFGGFDVPFKLDAEKFIASNGTEGYTPTFTSTAQAAVISGGKATNVDEARNYLAAMVIIKLEDQINLRRVKQETPVTVETPVEEAPKEEAPKEEESKAEEPKEETPAKKRLSMDDVDAIADNSSDARLMIGSPALETEDWEKAEAWLKKNFPNLPVYRVKNIIRSTNGKQLWGMLQNAAIYLSQNAEVGTVYHEVFEAVWKMFATYQEKQAVLKEFRQREGSFTDRFSATPRQIKYSEATDSEIKEELAEEFRDLILYKKEPPKVKSGNIIVRIFRDIVNFFREFFTGKKAMDNTRSLFEKIGSGYYAKYSPYEAKLSFAKQGVIDIEDVVANDTAEGRINKLAASQSYEIIQHMTFALLRDLTKTNQSLFKIPTLNKKDIYESLFLEVLGKIKWRALTITAEIEKGNLSPQKLDNAKNEVNNLRQLFIDIQDEWDNIVKDHEEYLRTFDIEFDENDEIELTEEKSKDDPYGNPRKIDSFRKANAAIKLLLGSLTYSTITEKATTKTERKVSYIPTSIGGAKLIPADQVHIDLLNNLSSSVNMDDMLERLRILAIKNPNYEALYKRLTKQSSAHPIDYQTLEEHDWQLLSSFWRSMKLQNADSYTIFILPSGEVIVTDSALNSSAKQAKYELTQEIKDKIRTGTKYFSYDKNKGTYSATKLLKDYKFSSSQIEQYTEFLKELGIVFNPKEISKLKPNQLNVFKKAVESIHMTFSSFGPKVNKAGNPIDEDGNELVTVENGVRVSAAGKPQHDTSLFFLSPKTFDVEGRLMELGVIKAILENPEYQSTFFNLNGERTQTYVGVNTLSNFYDVISKLKNINDLNDEKFSAYRYLLTDDFAQGSLILKRMFVMDGNGERREGTESIMKQSFVEGIIDTEKGRRKEAARTTLRQRLVMELNSNHEGIYFTLVPGDSSLEYAVKMHEKGDAFVTSQMVSTGAYLDIFRDYFISEMKVSRDDTRIVAKNKKKDLRFFKQILDNEALHNEIIGKSNAKLSPEQVYDKYKVEINKAIKRFVENETNDNFNLLEEFELVYYTDEGIEIEYMSFMEGIDITEQNIKSKLREMSINYMIANIELHKLIYSDPYRYNDELKRIKNFNSPRQPLMNVTEVMRNAMNSVFNKGYNKKDIGYTDFERNHFRTVTISDVFTTNSLPGYTDAFVETDGAGFISMKGNRRLRILSGDWTEDNERQYRYDIAYEKYHKGLKLTNREKEIFDPENNGKDNPNIPNTYVNKKPIVSGNKMNGRDYNDILIHKYALYVLSYRMLHEMNPESNIIHLYNKMNEEDVDYAVFESGVKGGGEAVYEVYDENGQLNTQPFETKEQQKDKTLPQGIINVPYNIISIQSEVPSKDEPYTTQGSQVTKLITMDFMEAGVPIDFMQSEKSFDKRYAAWIRLDNKEKLNSSPLYREIMINQTLLEARIEEGYKSLLKRLGIEEISNGYQLRNREKLIRELKSEILSREVNDNLITALREFSSQDIVLEATPAYNQIRNILYSFADKNVVRPKIRGGFKVQIPSTFLESIKAKAVDAKTKKGKQVKAYQSDILKFYEDADGKRYCEIMVARWFKSDKSDEELLNFFNNTEEGQRILSGVAYRIPTQKQNSIDVFRIARFLPEGYRDSVVIPSALVQKAGSDFDIDKLSIYLKNVYNDKGEIKIIPFFGVSKKAKAKMKEFVTELHTKGRLNKELIEITDEDFINERTDEWFMESLENEYIQSMENLASHPLNFANLIKPNSAEQMVTLSNKITKKLGLEVTDYNNTGNMLRRRFMSNLRYSFVSGKYSIGIAAVAQTNNAQNQRTLMYIGDINENTPEEDKAVLGAYPYTVIFANNTEINFPTYNTIVVDGKRRATLSKIKDSLNKNYISDIIGQFIDGYVDISKDPWIIRLGATQNVAGTWLFLIKIGVPISSVAYFMNQPIIRQYLKSLDNRGYSWLFIDDMIKKTLDDYQTEDTTSPSEIPSDSDLFDMIGLSPDQMTTQQLAQQQFILKEFLKYAKMSQHLLTVTQGTNFDTANLNDPYLIFKKLIQYENATKSIISSAEDLIKKSFINQLKTAMQNIRDAYATVLISDSPSETNGVSVRKVMEAVLRPYVGLNDRDFIKLAQKAVADLFDWAMQTDKNVAKSVVSALLGKPEADNKRGESYVKQIINFRDSIIGNQARGIIQHPEHPLYNNLVLRSLKYVPAGKNGAPDNLYIVAKDNKVYNQNLIINSFEELKKYLNDNNQSELYRKFLAVAVLQSGLKTSSISFTNLLPYEDFKSIYNEVLSKIEQMPNLADFHTAHVLERVNWNNDDVVPVYLEKAKRGKGGNYYFVNQYFTEPSLKNAVKAKKLPMTIQLSIHANATQSDFITYTWIEHLDKKKLITANKTGNTSHIHKVLMRKVYTEDESGNLVPLITRREEKGVIYEKFTFVAINAWGDSFRAQEFQNKLNPEDRASTLAGPSAIENGYMKIETRTKKYGDSELPASMGEVEDETVLYYLDNDVKTDEPKYKQVTVKLPGGGSLVTDNPQTLEQYGFSEEEIGRIIKDMC